MHKKSLEKEELCQRLKEQLDAIEKETASKLAEMDVFNSQLKVSVFSEYIVLQCLLFLHPIKKIGGTSTRLPKSSSQLLVSHKNFQNSWSTIKIHFKTIANVL